MKWSPDRPARRVLCAAVAAVLGAACIALGLGLGSSLTSTDAQAVVLAAPVALAVRAVRRCPHCGWIESKREILPSTIDPQALSIYEYTVRMGNGSSSVFREELPVSWRLGERLVYIAGARE